MSKEEWLAKLDPLVRDIYTEAGWYVLAFRDYDTLSPEFQLAAGVEQVFDEYYKERYSE